MFSSVLAFAASALIASAAAQSSSAPPASSAPASTSAAPPPASSAPATTSSDDNGSGIIPLTSRTYTYPDLPYQVDTNPTGRGPQSGYNICNSTTFGPNSNCQTSFINNASDFCLWGPTTPGGEIGDIEASTVAWCTASDHGTRQMPAGTITALQFLIAPAYVEVVGLINQGNIDEDPADSGGELDPHGADERGNPLGGLMFSNAFPQSAGNPTDYIQVIQWHSFMGSGIFCLKACNPAVANSAQYCDNIYDRIGCNYNAPAAYAPGVFETCLSDNQDPPGIYTGANGQITTWSQPGDATPINTMPYTAKIPASSSCTTYASSALFAGAPAGTATSAASTGIVTSAKAVSTAGGAASTNTSTSSHSGASTETVKLGGAVVAALGVIVGTVMVL